MSAISNQDVYLGWKKVRKAILKEHLKSTSNPAENRLYCHPDRYLPEWRVVSESFALPSPQADQLHFRSFQDKADRANIYSFRKKNGLDAYGNLVRLAETIEEFLQSRNKSIRDLRINSLKLIAKLNNIDEWITQVQLLEGTTRKGSF